MTFQLISVDAQYDILHFTEIPVIIIVIMRPFL